MTPRARVFAALERRQPDRIPRCEVWIDALIAELGHGDPATAYVNTGQDWVMLPSVRPRGSNAWGDGIDEWGRRWQGGIYVHGAVQTEADLATYTPRLETVSRYFDADETASVQQRYPDHCRVFGTHIGPFMAAYMAMGIDQFCYRVLDEPAFVRALLATRTDWAIAFFKEAVRLGAEVIVVGDDAAHGSGPLIAPDLWRALVLPCHRRLVQALDVPVIWHSDGNVKTLLPMAVEAGFAGFHGLEPSAGMDLAAVTQKYGAALALAGNVDARVLFEPDLVHVRREVERCVTERAGNPGYLFSSCNSIFPGMKLAAVTEMWRHLTAIEQASTP